MILSLGGERILENIWCIRKWMIIHSHEANPCFNKTDCPEVFRWQPMITHDPETEWVKITENWWKSGARGQMALKRRICDYYFLSLQSDRAWLYFLWKIYRAVDTVRQRENGCICFLPVANDWTPRYGWRNQPPREDAFLRRWLVWFTVIPSVKCTLRHVGAVGTSMLLHYCWNSSRVPYFFKRNPCLFQT